MRDYTTIDSEVKNRGRLRPMAFERRSVPITEDDATIRAALDNAAVGALLPAVAAVTGRLDLLHVDLRPDPSNVFDPEGGLTEGQLREARDLASAALAEWRDLGCPAPAVPDDATLLRLMAHVVGEENEGAYFELLKEELALGGVDHRVPSWHAADVAPSQAMRVVIVGAGMSGLVMAHRLQQAGVPFTIIEKNDDVGGTWFENLYPGCRVDVPNVLYSYSFAQKVWPQHFSTQSTLLDYFRLCADEFDLRRHIRFGTEVDNATWDENQGVWRVQVRTAADGTTEVLETEALVSAVGQLNRPKFPDIEGMESFEGATFHSARWRHDVDLTGKRVAVIGTGASAAQFIPIVADQVGDGGSLTIFQRTANWLIPSPDYHEDVSAGLRWVYEHVPGYSQWHRLWLFWRTHEGLLPGAVVDPAWPDQERSVSAINELIRLVLVDYLTTEIGDRPDLLAKITPDYPPIAKRIIRDNGVWARTLKQPNVTLLTDGIERIDHAGVATRDGGHHEFDVIIYGTGFHASEFLTPMTVRGVDGVDLHERWAGDARAYLGITVPEFPNLFCMYGPNTNIVINGSIIYFSECEAHYISECLRLLLAEGKQSLACRAEVHDEFNDRVDAANKAMAWGASSVSSWYKNANGRVAQNWPFSLLDYWEQTRTPNPADYHLS